MKNKQKNKIYFLLFFIIFLISGLTVSYADEPTKYSDTYLVEDGNTIEFTGEYSSITSSNEKIAKVKENEKIEIEDIGYFEITVDNTHKIKFFSWNAYLKQDKDWTYADENGTNKLNPFYSQAYLALEKINDATFIIKDYILAEDGSYSGILKGKYIANYCNEEGSSNSALYDYSMSGSDKTFQIDLSFLTDTVEPDPEPDPQPELETEPEPEPEPELESEELAQSYKVTQKSIIKTDVENSLPTLNANTIEKVLDIWGVRKYGEDYIKELKEKIYTSDFINKIVEIQNDYKISAAFILAVADNATDLGLNDGTDNNRIAGADAHNLFKYVASNDVLGNNKKNKYIIYNTYDESCEGFAKLITEYFDKGKTNIKQISKLYKPSNSEKWADNIKTRVNEILNYKIFSQPPANEEYTYKKKGKVVKQYSDTSIKVSVENISNCFVTKVWVYKPDQQVKKAEAGWGTSLKTVATMLNSKEHAIVGSNGSGFYRAGTWEPSQSAIRNTNWNKTTEGYLVISSNGEIRRKIPGHRCNYLIGIKPNGSFEYYGTSKYKKVIDDGVKATFTFGPLLIKDGKKFTQKTGSPRQDYNSSAPRTAVGQVDENNFIIITTAGSEKLTTLQTLGRQLNCKLLFNLDGGGSTSLWFRGKTSGTGSVVKGCTREIADALYFRSLS